MRRLLARLCGLLPKRAAKAAPRVVTLAMLPDPFAPRPDPTSSTVPEATPQVPPASPATPAAAVSPVEKPKKFNWEG